MLSLVCYIVQRIPLQAIEQEARVTCTLTAARLQAAQWLLLEANNVATRYFRRTFSWAEINLNLRTYKEHTPGWQSLENVCFDTSLKHWTVYNAPINYIEDLGHQTLLGTYWNTIDDKKDNDKNKTEQKMDYSYCMVQCKTPSVVCIFYIYLLRYDRPNKT